MPVDGSAVLRGKTLMISGGSRGIGLAIGVAAARLGANVTLLSKTDTPHPRLPGTIHTAAAEIEAVGGHALPVVGDVRDEHAVDRAVALAVERFGGIDVCLNNASALDLGHTEDVAIKKFDLMQQVQLRGTFLFTRACLPHLRAAPNPHILTLSPPLNFSPHWLAVHPPYTLSKYGMTILALGWAAEYEEVGIASNTLWPQSLIATEAVASLPATAQRPHRTRSPQIMADAAVRIISAPSRARTGHSYLDIDVLNSAGAYCPDRHGGDADYDIFVDPPEYDADPQHQLDGPDRRT